MPYVIRLISGRRQWYERIFREKALRLTAVFGRDFDVTLDQVEDYFGEIHEVFGERLRPDERLRPEDAVIGTCRIEA
jgi:hypothetical protein